MAVAVPLDQLTEQNEAEIAHYLTHKPEESFIAKKASRFKDTGEKEKTIRFYRYVAEEQAVYLPLAFAAFVTGKYLNDAKKYPKSALKFGFELLPEKERFKYLALQRFLPTDLAEYAITFIYPFGLRPKQTADVKLAHRQLQDYRTTTLHLPPGWGKTVEIAALAAKLKLITLVYINRKILIEQFVNTFEKFTNAKIWVVGERPPKECNVVVCMSERIKQIDKAFLGKVGLLVLDEAHTLCTPENAKLILEVTPKYVILASATPTRADGMHIMLHRLAGEHEVYRRYRRDMKVYKYLTGLEGTREPGQFGTKWDVLVKSFYLNDAFNAQIVGVCLTERDKKIMILSWQKDHCEIIREMLEEQGESVSTLYGKQEKYEDARILVATVSKAGTGFDQGSACKGWKGERINTILLVGSFKEHEPLEQYVGRAMRATDVTVYDFVHSDPTMERHFKLRTKWYLENYGTIVECRPQVEGEEE